MPMLLRSLPDVFCPWCVRQGGLEIIRGFVAKPIGTFSLAGAQMKLSMIEAPLLRCTLCKRQVSGRFDGTDAVFPDPHVGQETGQASQV